VRRDERRRKMRAWRLPRGCTSVRQLELVGTARPIRRRGRCWCVCTPFPELNRDQAIAQDAISAPPSRWPGLRSRWCRGRGGGRCRGEGPGPRRIGGRHLLHGWLHGPPSRPGARRSAVHPPKECSPTTWRPETAVVKLAHFVDFRRGGDAPLRRVTAVECAADGVRPSSAASGCC